MSFEFIPDRDGFIIIPEELYHTYQDIFKIFNSLSTKKANHYIEQNRKDVKHFMIVKGSEMSTLINHLVLPLQRDSKLLTDQLNKMREMLGRKILSMQDIFKFLEAQYILKFTEQGSDIIDKVANEV